LKVLHGILLPSGNIDSGSLLQIVKHNVIENIIPIVIAAKHLFEKERSPLLKDLLLYLKELMQDYRNEIDEILAADRQLAEEIEFDLKRFEEERKKITQPETPLSATPHAQMVHQIESILHYLNPLLAVSSILSAPLPPFF